MLGILNSKTLISKVYFGTVDQWFIIPTKSSNDTGKKLLLSTPISCCFPIDFKVACECPYNCNDL